VAAQNQLGSIQLRDGKAIASRLPTGYAHFTTRQNVQYNWIPLHRAADVMDLLASVDMHGIQTSGNCIRNITTDELAGIAVDEVADPRPFAEILRQWSTLHPEFAFLPRKFKIAITGAAKTAPPPPGTTWACSWCATKRASWASRCWWAAAWAARPVIATVMREFLPWNQILNYLEAVVRVYNRWGRRDNIYKARIKILVKAEGQRYIDEVEAEYRRIVEKQDGAPHTISAGRAGAREPLLCAATGQRLRPHCTDAKVARILRAAAEDDVEFGRWIQQNVQAAPEPRPARRDAVVQAPGPGPGRRHRRPAGRVAELAERSALAKPASRTTRTCCCPGCAATPCPTCGAKRAAWAWPSPTLAC
jgi:sulfite reductase (NADPH) hemoprotein beta-component